MTNLVTPLLLSVLCATIRSEIVRGPLFHNGRRMHNQLVMHHRDHLQSRPAHMLREEAPSALSQHSHVRGAQRAEVRQDEGLLPVVHLGLSLKEELESLPDHAEPDLEPDHSEQVENARLILPIEIDNNQGAAAGLRVDDNTQSQKPVVEKSEAKGALGSAENKADLNKKLPERLEDTSKNEAAISKEVSAKTSGLENSKNLEAKPSSQALSDKTVASGQTGLKGELIKDIPERREENEEQVEEEAEVIDSQFQNLRDESVQIIQEIVPGRDVLKHFDEPKNLRSEVHLANEDQVASSLHLDPLKEEQPQDSNRLEASDLNLHPAPSGLKKTNDALTSGTELDTAKPGDRPYKVTAIDKQMVRELEIIISLLILCVILLAVLIYGIVFSFLIEMAFSCFAKVWNNDSKKPHCGSCESRYNQRPARPLFKQ